MTTSEGVVRSQMYAASGAFSIKNIGDEEWVKPDHFPGSEASTFNNVTRPTFAPGRLSFIQYSEEPRYDKNNGQLTKDLNMWKANFNFADLYDIRVTESKFGQSQRNINYRIRIELTAACKVPPAGQRLMTAAGTKRDDVMDKAIETSDSIASSPEIANIANRWQAGNQEIKLTFTRTTQLKSGTKSWVWDAFMAFVCGAEWATQNRNALDIAAQKSLKEVVSAGFGNYYADFEMKEDGWVLIKPKFSISTSLTSIQRTEEQQHAVRGPGFGTKKSKAVATSSRDEILLSGEAAAWASCKGKQKAVEPAESSRSEERVRLECREGLKQELSEARGERRAWQAAESHARDMAEKAAEKERELQLWIVALAPYE